MLAFLTNLGLLEMVVILVVAVLIFGKNLPQAASKAYLQVRKLRNAVDDLRRDSGIEREFRDIERNVREAEWEARRASRRPAEAPAPKAIAPAAPAPVVAEDPAPEQKPEPKPEPPAVQSGEAPEEPGPTSAS